MNHFLRLSLVLLLLRCNGTKQTDDYPITPVPVTRVELSDRFWVSRLTTNRETTIPFCFQKCEETGRIDNFAKAAGLIRGKHRGNRYDDSDVYKIMEGAFYSLSKAYNRKLDSYLDSLSILISEAQEDDGYLYTARTIDPAHPPVPSGPARWSRLESSHELYNVGHLYEAAVASAVATGKEILLDAAIKNAELIGNTFGRGRRTGISGHQEIEIGLVKLYRLTGNRRYLDLARYFLDVRGRHTKEALRDSMKVFRLNQNHQPVTEQEEAVGHAVKATYMYSAMADIAALTGRRVYAGAIDRIWNNVVSKKMYITGGIGSSHEGEAFGENYQLSNAAAYTETCAAIGNALFNHRLFLLHGDGKYVDVLERILYNGFLSGVSMSGDRFFYSNPLESDGVYLFNKGASTRQPWFNCSCCPSNVARFMPSIPGFLYATRDDDVYINLFIGSTGDLVVKGHRIRVRQKTDYPWNGKIKIVIEPEKAATFSVKIRIPGWVQHQPVPSDLYRYIQDEDRGYAIQVNRQSVAPPVVKGFATIRRKWETGDAIELDFPMVPRRVVSHPAVKENTGRVALERGPLVYCAEWADNGTVLDLHIPDASEFQSEYRKDLLNGIVILRGDAADASGEIRKLTAIPYYAWSHRGVGEMAVWLPRKPSTHAGPLSVKRTRQNLR